jgi:hypothetical protein
LARLRLLRGRTLATITTDEAGYNSGSSRERKSARRGIKPTVMFEDALLDPTIVSLIVVRAEIVGCYFDMGTAAEIV